MHNFRTFDLHECKTLTGAIATTFSPWKFSRLPTPREKSSILTSRIIGRLVAFTEYISQGGHLFVAT